MNYYIVMNQLIKALNKKTDYFEKLSDYAETCEEEMYLFAIAI